MPWIALLSVALLIVAACDSPTRPTPISSTPTPAAPVPVPPAPQGLVDLSGDYTLTFQVGSGCAELPNELRTRTYVARIRWHGLFGSSVSFIADLSEAEFHDDQRPVWFDVTDNSVAIDLSDNVILEQPSPGAYFATSGHGVASVQPSETSTISGSFAGYFKYCAPTPGAAGTDRCSVVTMTEGMCKADNSRWTLTRR